MVVTSLLGACLHSSKNKCIGHCVGGAGKRARVLTELGAVELDDTIHLDFVTMYLFLFYHSFIVVQGTRKVLQIVSY
jgi:hypothetical protein